MRITFVHGRPGPHGLHKLYGLSLTDRHRFVDPLIRWHDLDIRAPWRYVVWIVNSLCFVSLRKNIVITEGLHITLLISKLFSLGRLKLVCLAGDESPYFIKSRYYKGLSYSANVFAFRHYDGIICISEMVREIMEDITRDTGIPLRTGINGVSRARLPQLIQLRGNITSMNLVCIANGPGGWRSWYKGMDLMMEAFGPIANENPQVTLQIVGTWHDEEIHHLKRDLSAAVAGRVHFLGHKDNLEEVLVNAGLCLHIGRGEAWGISVIEAMAAGVPAMVSEWTGAKECVQQVDPALVVPLDASAIMSRLRWYLDLPETAKKDLSVRARQVAEAYSEANAVAIFAKNFREIMAEIQ